MKILESGLYQTINTISNFFLLNILWLLMCLPIVTIFPATAALFAVLREWQTKRSTQLFTIFFRYFKENLIQSVMLSIIWAFCASILYVDFLFTNQITTSLKPVFSITLIIATILFSFTTIYLFPVMTQYKSSVFKLIKASFLLSIGNLPLTILCFVVLGLITALAYVFPLSIFLSISIGAYFIYAICHNAFNRVEKERKAPIVNNS